MSLTAKQETYCQERSNGTIQYEAYKIAYPKSLEWKRNAVDTQASILESNSKILERIEELNKPQEDLLESNRNKLIEMGLRASLGQLTEEESKLYNPQVLNNMLNKLLASKSDSKVNVVGLSLVDLIKAKSNG